MSHAVAVGAPGRAEPDFEAIEQAVRESQRGRWFLEEYAKRLRRAETSDLLQAIGRLEGVVAASQDALTERLSKALGVIVPAVVPVDPPSAKAQPAPMAAHQMKYFKQDEDIFAPAPVEAKPAPTLVTTPPAPPPAKPEVARGAKLVIRRHGMPEAGVAEPPPEEPAADGAASAPQPVADADAAAAPGPAPHTTIMDSPKRRIVIIRHKAGERIDVPLQPEVEPA